MLRLHEVLAMRSKVYLVMELAPGGDLLSRLASLSAQAPRAHRTPRVPAAGVGAHLQP
ncbi:CBL-interacting protein kinase 7 [Panicum miliaceum]|uniref:CBL-interacting protein kinase 7 n=1 Tax=Panicum miliaceum TaxID=4540 RepID=A0A3L6PAH2_PANMI|nr:CBL-interacting protein kinase 7 [Panicum miliaceum]